MEREMGELYISVDIGATKTRIALCDRSGIIDKQVIQTPRSGDEEAIPRLIYELAISKWGERFGDVRAVGISSIGPMDIRRGILIKPPNLEFERVPLLPVFRRLMQRRVYLVNDAVAAAWGEKVFGIARDYENIAYITLSTGVGGGIIVNGIPLLGKQGNAHEIGHLVIDMDSELVCGCGGRGHWEALAGGRNLPRVARYLLSRGEYRGELADLIRRGGDIDAKVIFEYYRRGDDLARDVIELFIRASAAGLASVINAYDPEIVIFGGSVMLNNADILLDRIVELASESVITDMPRVELTRFGDDVGLYGGLAIATRVPENLRRLQGE